LRNDRAVMAAFDHPGLAIQIELPTRGGDCRAAASGDRAATLWAHLWHVAQRRIRAMGIRDKPTAPAASWQNGFAERLIGSIRRQCLDHLLVLGEAHLRKILQRYADYCNEIRTHRSLGKNAPCFRPVHRVGNIASHAILGGLHHHYFRV
jgi:hypothetical protein